VAWCIARPDKLKNETIHKSRILYTKKRVVLPKGYAMHRKGISTALPLTEKRLVNTIWLKEDGISNPFQNAPGAYIPKDARLLGVNALSLIRKELHD